jgi:hypothetical protein
MSLTTPGRGSAWAAVMAAECATHTALVEEAERICNQNGLPLPPWQLRVGTAGAQPAHRVLQNPAGDVCACANGMDYSFRQMATPFWHRCSTSQPGADARASLSTDWRSGATPETPLGRALRGPAAEHVVATDVSIPQGYPRIVLEEAMRRCEREGMPVPPGSDHVCRHCEVYHHSGPGKTHVKSHGLSGTRHGDKS